MSRPRVFLDSCVLIGGLVAPWSASRGVLVFGRYRLTFVLAEIVIEEAKHALARRLGSLYGGGRGLEDDLAFLLERWNVERIPHVSKKEIEEARAWIRRVSDVPVIAAAVKGRPDCWMTDNTAHFNAEVASRTGLRIVTPAEFLATTGRILSQ